MSIINSGKKKKKKKKKKKNTYLVTGSRCAAERGKLFGELLRASTFGVTLICDGVHGRPERGDLSVKSIALTCDAVRGTAEARVAGPQQSALRTQVLDAAGRKREKKKKNQKHIRGVYITRR
jgi:hypothetical protein